MAKQNILDLETAIAGISAVATPNPYTVGNFVSHITTGQSIGANLPGAAGETVRNVEGAVKDAITEATESGTDNNKKNNKQSQDQVSIRARFRAWVRGRAGWGAGLLAGWPAGRLVSRQA